MVTGRAHASGGVPASEAGLVGAWENCFFFTDRTGTYEPKISFRVFFNLGVGNIGVPVMTGGKSHIQNPPPRHFAAAGQ